MEILKVGSLCKTYGKGNNQVQALKDISFSVEKGEFVAIVGQSGSGKSTLLHLIGGVDKPTAGHIFVDGQDVYKKNREQLAIFRRRQVGLIYQFYNLIPILNVVENMTLPLKLDGQKVNDERVKELLEVLGLVDRKSICQVSSLVVSSSGYLSAEHSSMHRHWYWRMNLPEILIVKAARRLWSY